MVIITYTHNDVYDYWLMMIIIYNDFTYKIIKCDIAYLFFIYCDR